MSPANTPSHRTFETSLRTRCRVVGRTRHHIADRSDALVRACRSPQRTDDCETLSAELIPLCDAIKYVGRHGGGVLRDRRVTGWGRPLWLWGVSSVVQRVPLGDVLVIGTWNYPLLLPGVQAAQALVAGNRVIVKPAVGAEAATQQLIDCFHAAGVPQSSLRMISSDVAAAERAIDDGVDLIVLTGSAETGRRVLRRAADRLTPAVMELSGCDAVIVLEGADVDRVAAAVRFGLTFNGGATCIGPRRLLLATRDRDRVAQAVIDAVSACDPVTVHPAAVRDASRLIRSAIDGGGVAVSGRCDVDRLDRDGVMHPLVLDRVASDAEILSCDVFAPVITMVRCDDAAAAVDWVNGCRYRLAAAVFGRHDLAVDTADRLRVGCVTVNDLIAPTADPRLPFGGRGESGFGVTRGAEGLLAMTTPRVITTRRGRVTPHLSPRQDGDAEVLSGAVQLMHGGGWAGRGQGLRRIIAAVRNQRRGG